MVMRYLGGFNAPSYNPLASNVTTGANTVQQGGIYTSSSASQNIPLGQWVNDQYYNRTSLLLQADNFANGSQNNTFIDSSTNNFTITRNGNATQGNFSPFSNPNGYWSNYFDGSGDYLTVTGSSNLAFGSNSFTIEFFIYFTSVASAQNIYDARPASTNGAYPVIYLDNTTGKIIYYVNTAARITSDAVVLANQWYHIAVAKNGTGLRMFINGIQQGGVILDTTTYLNGTTRPIIGASSDLISPVVGYISNLRVLNGTGLYTTNFDPPISPLTAITNTQLLTCQSNRFVDNSANAYVITKAGDTAIRPFTPFNSFTRFNGPTGTGSINFPGTADNAATFTGTTIPIDQTNFTIEGWVYITAANSGIWPCMVGDMVGGGGADINWTFGPRSNNKLSFQYRTGSGVYGPSTLRTSTALALNTWYYIAASCEGNTLRLYIDGVQQSLDSGGDSYGIGARLETSGFTTVGSIPNGGTGNAFAGLISNLSITNGTAKYTGSTFTIPTGPSPAVATNQVLLFASPFAVDSNATVAPKAVTITGAVRNNVGTPFATPPVGFANAGGAAYFDGTGDYLDLTGSSNLAFGTGDWTIELWYYTNTVASDRIIYDSRPAGTQGAYPTIYQSGTSLFFLANSANLITSSGTIATGTWYHILVSKVSGQTRMFLNGTQQGSTYTDSINYLNGASRPRIGDGGVAAGSGVFGYISNLRVVKGSGVTSVTVPTAPLVPIANTQLLLNNTNAGISDGTNINTFETVGNAQVSTAIKKYGSGSMFFDGTGDWLLIPDNFELRLGAGDFTVECWVYVSSFAAARSMIGKGTSSTGWFFYVATTGRLAFGYDSATLNGNNALVLNTWNHVAVVRFGALASNVRMYINGNLDVASTSVVSQNFNQTNNMYVGADRTATNPFLGYIDDLRVTKNFARYTSNFVPPTVALPRLG